MARGCVPGVWSAEASWQFLLANHQRCSGLCSFPQGSGLRSLCPTGDFWPHPVGEPGLSTQVEAQAVLVKCGHSQAAGPTELVLLPSGPLVGSWTNCLLPARATPVRGELC